MDMLDIQSLALDRIYQAFERTAVSSAIPEKSGPQQPMSRCSDLVEGLSPAADTGTAGVGVLYPVTCEERYYDAASALLEDTPEGEPSLFTHDNCNELGALIQQWISDARDNWEPR
jgi:hypothetical protein